MDGRGTECLYYQQDHLLCGLKQKKSLTNWKQIATQINQSIKGNEKTGKQCRERYTNYARFRADQFEGNDRWCPEQDELLFKKFMTYGPKWVLISSQLTNKSQNVTKNRFYNALGRIQRKIRKIQLKRKIKNKKPITTKRLCKIFHELGTYLEQKQPNLPVNPADSPQLHLFAKLADDLIRIAMPIQRETSEQQIYWVINAIHQFQLVLRDQQSSQEKELSDGSKKKEDNSRIFQQPLSDMEEKTSKAVGENWEEMDKGEERTDRLGCLPYLDDRLSLLPELSQLNYQTKGSKNLEQEVCLIENREYVPENFLFIS